jgi:HPt (histidine-containing phosphotransfer) domain-containing protein
MSEKVDFAVLDEACSALGAAALLELFTTHDTQQFGELKACLASGSVEQAARAAHKLKGTVTSIN